MHQTYNKQVYQTYIKQIRIKTIYQNKISKQIFQSKYFKTNISKHISKHKILYQKIKYVTSRSET